MDEERPLTSADAFALRRQGKFQEAVDAYSKLYELDGRSPSLLGRGKTYLRMGNYAAALADFELAIAIEDPNFLGDSHFLSQGIAYWFLDQPHRTLEVWQQGLKAPYTDAAGGVELPALLLYAAERLKDSVLRRGASKLLKKFARRRRGALPGGVPPFLLTRIGAQGLLRAVEAATSEKKFASGSVRAWPGDVAPFLLGKIGPQEVLKDIEARKSERLKRRFQCQADFFIGLRAYMEDDKPAFQEAMVRCSENPYGDLHHEYYLAQWEVEHRFPEPAFSS